MSDADVAKADAMIDTDMIASPNFARLVYDGDGSSFGPANSGPAGSGTIENVFVRYWAQRGLVSEPIPFHGRSDYVGFIRRGIPAGGVFAGAEAPRRPRRSPSTAASWASSSIRATTRPATPTRPSRVSRRRTR